MELEIVTLAARPDLAPLLNGFPGAWPQFMYEDQVASLHYEHCETAYAEHTLLALDRADPSRAVAKAFTVPYTAPDVLPATGWDGVVLAATNDLLAGRTGVHASALEITIQPDLRGRGLAPVLLDAMRRNVRRLGHDLLVAPVRPNGKPRFPDEAMDAYLRRLRPDGLPDDAWLRVHVRAGGQIDSVAPRSMTIAGTLAEWRAWTGLPFDTDGPVVVPGALVPVRCVPAQDVAIYVEPNVWVRHRL